MLLQDEDDMVQKGLGWLLRETAKADAKRTVPYLLMIRRHSPRLVLRTACETLSQADKTRILSLAFTIPFAMNLSAIQSALRERNLDGCFFMTTTTAIPLRSRTRLSDKFDGHAPHGST